MIMTKDDAAMTPLAELLLSVLREAAGDWLTRPELAQRIGRPTRLTPYDVQILDHLEADGLIEIERKTVGPVQKVYQYRAK